MGVGSQSSYWSQTNEVHDNDHEYENMDDEGEGLMEAPKGRMANYTVQDDVLLCHTWLNVSLDATVATAQTMSTYWERMMMYYNTHNKNGVERSNRSLRSRWSLINSECQRWTVAMTAVDALNPSGTNEDDRVNAPKALMEQTLCYVLFYVLLTCFLLLVAQYCTKLVSWGG